MKRLKLFVSIFVVLLGIGLNTNAATVQFELTQNAGTFQKTADLFWGV